VRQFDRNFRLKTAFSDALQNLEIVFRNLLRLGAVLDVFARCVKPFRSSFSQNLRRAKRIISVSPGMNGIPCALQTGKCLADGATTDLRCCKQHRSHQTHECLASCPVTQALAATDPAHHSKAAL